MDADGRQQHLVCKQSPPRAGRRSPIRELYELGVADATREPHQVHRHSRDHRTSWDQDGLVSSN
jgi:hypothetical protein